MSKRKLKPQSPLDAAAPYEMNEKRAVSTPVFMGEPPTIDPESGRQVRLAEDWQQESADLPWQVRDCYFCNDLIATRLPAKHDCCEDCGWRVRQEAAEYEMRLVRRRADVYINPFGGPELAPPQGPLPPIFGRRSLL